MSGEGGFNDEAYDSGMQAILDEDKEAGGEMTITDWTEVHESFDAMNLHENLLRGIYAAYGFEGPPRSSSAVSCPSPRAWT